MTEGILYLVGTPIGNLEDMTFRSISILQQVDMVVAEDTRHTGRLLHHFKIHKPQVSYHRHNRQQREEYLISLLLEGKSLALLSDAGMPCISDPGYELVKVCRSNGIKVIPIPGVTAVITALSASGLPTDRFSFEGFLPVKRKEWRERLESLKKECRTLVFYESPHQLRETLEHFKEYFGGDRSIVIARELTKLYEEFWTGSIESAITLYEMRQPKGEYTLIVAPALPERPVTRSTQELQNALALLVEQGMSKSQASRQLAQETGIPRRELYQLLNHEEY